MMRVDEATSAATYLIEQDDREGVLLQGIDKQATRLMADVAWWGANERGEAVLLLVLRLAAWTGGGDTHTHTGNVSAASQALDR